MRNMFVVMLFMAAAAFGGELHFDAARPCGTVLVDSPAYDLRPGLRMSCRVKADVVRHNGSMGTVFLRKGRINEEGSFLLRADGVGELPKFSFFVNFGEGPEPRVSVPGVMQTNAWYDIAAGWDGTNTWITVNGVTAKRRRKDGNCEVGCPDPVVAGPMYGTLADVKIEGVPPPVKDKVELRPGLRFHCTAEFLQVPTGGETTIVYNDAYWLRYDGSAEKGCFNLYMKINGSWDPRASVRASAEVGRKYDISGSWDGMKVRLTVGGVGEAVISRRGFGHRGGGRVSLGMKGRMRVTDFACLGEPRPAVLIGELRTRSLMPREGTPETLQGIVLNAGVTATDCRLEVKAHSGKASPAVIDLGALAENSERPLEIAVEPGEKGRCELEFRITSKGRTISRATHSVVFLPARDPDWSAKAWTPPVKPLETHYVDSDTGDDAKDGLSPATAWRTLERANKLALGPGGRLLLRRGCVFDGTLSVAARGSAENWAEIGAYGEGARPTIRRHRHIDERCALLEEPQYLVVRDLIVCNAGSGISISCTRSDSGHVLVERVLAHHIEGHYRYNSHGIPEWSGSRGVPGPGGHSSCGIYITAPAGYAVLRDSEAYQCSSGFRMSGFNTEVNRVYSHHNYAHNTSPHPYNLASRSLMTDCVFDASGWHASAGTMGVMLCCNRAFIIRGCHFLNQPDSGSADQGGVDFENQGDNCLIDACTFRNNAGAAIEVLGLQSPQTRNVHIRGCRFDRDNFAYKNGPAEIQVWGSPNTGADVACSNGRIEENGYVLIPGVDFYVNESRTTNDWQLVNNRCFDFAEELDRAMPYPNPPKVSACGEIWTDRPEAALSAALDDVSAKVTWEQLEGPRGVGFAQGSKACTLASFPGEGDYRLEVKADNGTLWRSARTAVHVLPSGERTSQAWDFAKNLDSQGWQAVDTGADYAFEPGKNSTWDTHSYPVRLVCGDYYVVTMKNSGAAAIVTPDDRKVGVTFSGRRVNAMRVKLQNRTNSKAMRLSWQLEGRDWQKEKSVAFPVKPQDGDDTVYEVKLPQEPGSIARLKLSFSADGEPVTGTVRIDYIWLGNVR